jgi:hypothetical protein
MRTAVSSVRHGSTSTRLNLQRSAFRAATAAPASSAVQQMAGVRVWTSAYQLVAAENRFSGARSGMRAFKAVGLDDLVGQAAAYYNLDPAALPSTRGRTVLDTRDVELIGSLFMGATGTDTPQAARPDVASRSSSETHSGPRSFEAVGLDGLLGQAAAYYKLDPAAVALANAKTVLDAEDVALIGSLFVGPTGTSPSSTAQPDPASRLSAAQRARFAWRQGLHARYHA